MGEKTLEVCATARIDVLALEADKTLLLNREQVEVLVKKNRISVVTVGAAAAQA